MKSQIYIRAHKKSYFLALLLSLLFGPLGLFYCGLLFGLVSIVAQIAILYALLPGLTQDSAVAIGIVFTVANLLLAVLGVASHNGKIQRFAGLLDS